MLCAVYKILGLFEALTPDEIEKMAPSTRERFAALCRHWADLAERPAAASPTSIPKSGILSDLGGGARAD